MSASCLGGALMQLVAIGLADAVLTGHPLATFSDRRERRGTGRRRRWSVRRGRRVRRSARCRKDLEGDRRLDVDDAGCGQLLGGLEVPDRSGRRVTEYPVGATAHGDPGIDECLLKASHRVASLTGGR